MGYPNSNSQLDDALQADFVQNTVSCLMELSNRGRPGIETLSLSLSTSRQNFWAWCNGLYKNAEWQEVCLQAKQVIISFLECASLQGKLNPATSIFLLKNWANYADTVTLETGEAQTQKALTAGALPKLGSQESEDEK